MPQENKASKKPGEKDEWSLLKQRKMFLEKHRTSCCARGNGKGDK